jgi:hypothetical protein
MCCDTHESINKVYFPPRGLLARAERRLETFFTGAVVPPPRAQQARTPFRRALSGKSFWRSLAEVVPQGLPETARAWVAGAER